MEATNRAQQRVLIILLCINAAMFIIEGICGVIAESSGLIADAADMLADAMVYGIALYAVGHSREAKISAARISGIFQIAIGAGIGLDIVRRIIFGSEPESLFMLGIGALALIANIICLTLIAKHRHGEVHMRASWIFSKNDVIANLGVIIGGILVMVSGYAWPDLIIGALITLLVIKGGTSIIKEAARESRDT